jgi:hypothetical protein
MLTDEDQKQQMGSFAEEISKFTFHGYASSFAVGDVDRGLFQSTTITQVEPTRKWRDFVRRQSEAMPQIENPGMKTTVEFKPEAETIEDHPVDLISVNMEPDPAVDPQGMQQKMIELMYGPEGATQRIAYLDDNVVQTLGGGADAMAQALRAINQTNDSKKKSKGTSLEKTRKELDETANFVGLIDLPALASRLAESVSRFAEENPGALPLPVDLEELDEPEEDRTYTGVSLTFDKGGIRAFLFVPNEQIVGLHAISRAFPSP